MGGSSGGLPGWSLSRPYTSQKARCSGHTTPAPHWWQPVRQLPWHDGHGTSSFSQYGHCSADLFPLDTQIHVVHRIAQPSLSGETCCSMASRRMSMAVVTSGLPAVWTKVVM